MLRCCDEGLRLRAVRSKACGIRRRAEASVFRRRVVDCNRRAKDRRRDGHGYESEDQKLLTPFASKESPRPMRHRPTSRKSTVRRTRISWSSTRLNSEVVHHDAGFTTSGFKSSSGLGGGNVSSTALPSRRNTTRSAHEASLASWVTTTAATPL